uniref:Integrase catalytic domain-containing protein n=1 Tax=Meloidogyne enterolobii TaxID=390850 RepID=A0A6V7XBE3_MELEN|nr:unnamed protein product [Meloidogyne enterolobii]
MNLREFLSHRRTIMEQIPEEDRLVKAKAQVLGIKWNTDDDSIALKFPKEDVNIITRRTVLSALASIYDPLGLINPCLLQVKLFFQRLWDNERTWDTPINTEETIEWQNIKQSWNDQIITLQRQAIVDNPTEWQLHVFSDASENAYAACVYLRSSNGPNVKATLIFARNRLRPKKAKSSLTIPRMELLGALIAVRAKIHVETELHRPISAVHFWLDSRIVLAWIQSVEPKPQFEQRRLAEIRNGARGTFHFVRTEQNSADIATRGSTPMELQKSTLWWNGPEWIVRPSDEWPDELSFNIDKQTDDNNPTDKIDTTTFSTKEPEPPTIDPGRFSSIFTLLRVVIWVIRFMGRHRPNALNIGTSKVSRQGPMTVDDYRAARIFIIRQEQNRLLANYNTHPTAINNDGLLCLKTRVNFCDGPETMALPILLDRHSPLTRLLVEEIHVDLKHAGVDWTMTEFLSRYWMPQSRRTIRGILHKCLQCRRQHAPPFVRPLMPQLPSMRVRPAKPFEFVGIDFLGPTTTNYASQNVKIWIIIICCMVTRGIYLEPTRDMSSLSVVNVLRRFISRRGKPRRILSDNAPTFIQVHKALDLLTGPPPEKPPWDYTTKNGIRWDFIPSYAPWMGATYERLIGLVKRAIQRTIGKRILDYDDLGAFLAEVEASVNSRPITWVSDQPGAPKPLTPKDLIQNSGPNDLGPTDCDLDYDDEKLSGPEKLAALWNAYRKAADVFWSRWSNEYILAIRERAGWTHKGPRSQTTSPPKIGQVVLVEMDLRPRNLWPLAKIVELNGSANEIRSVNLLTGDGKIITRPVSRLCPLETEIDEPSTNTSVIQDETPKESTKPIRQHQMTLRPRKSIVNTTTLVTFLVLLVNIIGFGTTTPWYRCGQYDYSCLLSYSTIASALSLYEYKCENCQLQCSNKGVIVKAPPEVQKTAVCCMKNCIDHTDMKEYTYELTAEIIINDYECEAWFWQNSHNSITKKINCPAVNECDLIDCYFCLEQLANPTCNVKWATFLFLLGIFAVSSLFGCFITIFSSIRIVGKLIVNSLTTLSHPFVWMFNKIRKREKEAWKRQINSAERKLYQRLRNIHRPGHQLRKKFSTILFIAASITAITIPAMAVISITTQTESCLRGTTGLTCTVNSANTLTLLPAGQVNTLLLRDEHGLTLGTLSMRLTSLKMACHQQSIAWLRSYRVEPTAVKRCPRAGSCFNDHCENVRPSSYVKELQFGRELPGNTFCIPSTSFWGNNCGLPSSACLYYRYFARPTSQNVFEVFTCPSWTPEMDVELTLETNGGKRRTKSIILHPGITSSWGNITITPLAISLPPMPVLGSIFVTNGQTVSIVSRLPVDLHCATEEAARSLNCSLDQEACKECFPNHNDGTVECSCRDVDLDAMMENPETRLPITRAKVWLDNNGPSVSATYVYAPIQIHLQMKSLALHLQLRDSKCFMDEARLHGCYRCGAGAQITYKCRSDNANVLATVKCEDGTLFVAHCSTNGTLGKELIPIDYADVNTICTVDCPAGETNFILNGSLYYIPLRRQWGHHQHRSK